MKKQENAVLTYWKDRGGKMFGYIRTQAEELRVREYAYYRSVYCGLCRCMEKTVSPLLSATLRYEYVLLALVRMLIAEEPGEITMRRCAANPLKKRPTMKENDALVFSAQSAAMLIYYQLLDHARDEKGLKGVGYRLLSPPAAMLYRTAKRKRRMLADAQWIDEFEVLDASVQKHLCALSNAERRGEISPDCAAQYFGELLAELFSCGLQDEAQKRIAYSIGLHTGRFIYLCDACDDVLKDEKSGSYNPFVLQAKEEHIDAACFMEEHRERILNALTLECSAAYNAALLAKGAHTHPAWPCVENIFVLGMPAVARHVTMHPGEPLPSGDAARRRTDIPQ